MGVRGSKSKSKSDLGIESDTSAQSWVYIDRSIKKVIFLGTKGVGKTTLCQAIASVYSDYKPNDFHRPRSYYYKDKIHNVDYRLMDGYGSGSWYKMCFIFWICSLNQCSTPKYSKYVQNPKPAIIHNLEHFKQTGTNEREGTQLQDTKIKIIVILNELESFKDYLVDNSLNDCFGEEYKGRNYQDCPFKITQRLYQAIIEFLMNDDEFDWMVPIDVGQVIFSYFPLRNEHWLNLVFNDGIDFFQQKFISIKPDDDIDFCLINPFNKKEVRQFMDDIHLRIAKTCNIV